MPRVCARRVSRAAFLALSMSLLFAPYGAYAEEEYVPVYHPTLAISRAAGPIEVDAKLEDAGWSGAVRANHFAEHNPGDQTKPDVETEVWVAYDDDNLYVAWLCHDEPTEVRASFCERDRIFSDDYVILCLDPFGEATLAYEISANPYGIPGDLLFSSANGEDSSYDMIFESAGRITDFGWVVEMAVPFASMRFPDREEQVWRVDFWRNRPRESRYQYSWAAYDRDEECWPCQWGTVTGIDGVRPGAGIELLPSLIGHQTGSLDDDYQLVNEDVDSEVALGVAYDISSELTAEATMNPDFSQVESDAAQIDVNTTFALFYPERRPFFQEGSDLFNTYFNALYTRSVNDPLLAGKMTWRKGSNSVALLSARDEHSVIILPFEESSAFVVNGKSYSNVVRARRDFGDQSHLGVIGTDRRFDNGGAGTLVGVDGRVRLSPSDRAQFQVLATRTEEVDNLALTDSAFNETRFDGDKHTAGLDGETFWGHAVYGSLSRNARSYWFGTDYWERSPTFRADNGFEPSNNSRLGQLWVGGIKRFEESDVLENINGRIDAAREWNFGGARKDEWISVSGQARLRSAQTSIHPRYMRSNEVFGGTYFPDIWQAHTCTSVQPGAALRFGAYGNYGHRIARNHLVMGKETSYGAWADLRPLDRLLIETSFDHIFSDDLESDLRLFSQSVLRSRFSLQISRELSARIVVQYRDRSETWYDQNDEVDDDYHSKRWDFDPLITYRINPLSIFYVGSTHDFRELNLADHGRQGWKHSTRQYFIKLQYLFQL